MREKLLNVGLDNCYISEITIAELYFGVAKAENKKRKLEDIKRVQQISRLFLLIPHSRNMVRYAIRWNIQDFV